MKTASTNGSVDPKSFHLEACTVETLVTRAGPVWPSNEQYLLEQCGFSSPFPDPYNHNGLHVHPDVIRSAASNISTTENIFRNEKIMNVKRKCEESSETIGLTDKRPAKKKPSGAGKDVHHSSKSDLIILKNNAASRSEAASNAAVENNKKRNEMKREKRKQSIRESAKKSKLCWEQEFENFQADADRLSIETAVLTNDLRRISEECANLIEENDSLMDEMEETCGSHAISDLKAMKPGGCSKDRSLGISSD